MIGLGNQFKDFLRVAVLHKFFPDLVSDLLMMTGGYFKQHSLAQIDAWERIISFLDRTLKYSKPV